jgi:hypothetical protein
VSRPLTHGISGLKSRLRRLGTRVIDARTYNGRLVHSFTRQLIADQGGEENLSAARRALVEAAGVDFYLLLVVDAYLVGLDSLVNRKRRQLYPVVLQRRQIADGLAARLSLLGIERRARELPSLQEYLREKEQAKQNGSQPA